MNRKLLRPVVLLIAASGVILAQAPSDPQSAAPSNGGWRRMSDSPPAAADAQDQSAPAETQQDPAQPAARDAYGQMQQQPTARPPAAQPPRPAYGLPAQVTVKQGNFLTMRINQALASNKNAVGDGFSGVLTQPVVANGIVVAQRGQMVYGKVVEAQKVKGVWRLGVALTSLTLADGSQVPIQTQLASRQGPTTPGGVQAGVITTTTAGGAVVGGIAGGGMGAGVGAGAGALAGIAAVIATKNHPSVIYPETMLTFQLQNAVDINTNNPSAFRYVGPDDYGRPATMTQQVPVRSGYGPGYPYAYPYPYYPYWGGGYPYWGPSLFIGGGFGWGGFGGFRGGFRR